MKITQTHTPDAILPEDRGGRPVIDGAGTILFSRNEYPLYIEGVSGWSLRFMTIVGLQGSSRIRRFFAAVPHLWRFCK